LRPASHANPGKTGIYRLPDPRDAFAARVLLAGAAEKSLDVQYFIWHGDHVGYLLFEALWQAAERGVRVRLLLDDLNTKGLDPTIATLDAHPNIEVRLYNPVVNRDNRLLNFVTDFSRVNRRMHNKSFTADNQATVVGGRNVADEYFGAGTASRSPTWTCSPRGRRSPRCPGSSMSTGTAPPPIRRPGFVGSANGRRHRPARAKFAATRADPESISYLETIRTTPLMRDLLDRKLALEWAATDVVYDDPAKTLDTEGAKTCCSSRSSCARWAGPKSSSTSSRPTSCPAMAAPSCWRRGQTRRDRAHLTNSLAASDEKSVHSGYAKRRRELLQAGVRLYEIKPTATKKTANPTADSDQGRPLACMPRRSRSTASGSSSARSISTSARRTSTPKWVWCSAIPSLAQGLTRFFDVEVPMLAYEGAAGRGRQEPGVDRANCIGREALRHEPETSWSTRMGVDLLSILPIEWLL
jgi:putative cardiolipin synthase